MTPEQTRRAKERFRTLRERASRANFSTPQGAKTIFDYYQQAGYLPAKDAQGHPFKSLEEFLQIIQKRVNAIRKANPKISAKEALRLVESQLSHNKALRSAKTGEDVLKVADALKADPTKRLARQRAYSGLPLSISDTGTIGIDKRKYMSADGGLPRPVFDEIVVRRGIEEATRYEKAVKAEWKAMGDLGRQLSNETGVPFHRGHWLANKYGGAESARAGSLEIGPLNELHGASPRGDIVSVAETGRGSMGWMEDFTNWDLEANGLNVLGAEHLKHSDRQAISNGVDYNKLIAQRTAEFEARGRVPDPDEIGLIFGSQLDRDETVQSQLGRLAEEQKLSMQETGFDPRYGRASTPERLAEVSKEAYWGNKSVPKIPKDGGRLAPVLATEPAGNRLLAEQLERVGDGFGRLKFKLPEIPAPLLKTAAVVGAALPIFDAADAVAGTMSAADKTKSSRDRVDGGVQAVGGASGLAALAPIAAAPVLGAVAVGAAAYGAGNARLKHLAEEREKNNTRHLRYLEHSVSGKPAQIKPLTNHNRASLKPTPNMPKPKEKSPLEHLINEGKWGLKQLGINL